MPLSEWITNARNWMAAETYEVDDTGVRRWRGEEIVEEVSWDSLSEVFVLTTSDGPFAEDFFWMIVGAGGGLAIGGEEAQAHGLLEHLQTLPGFDNEALIMACGSCTEARFDLWRRDEKLETAA